MGFLAPIAQRKPAARRTHSATAYRAPGRRPCREGERNSTLDCRPAPSTASKTSAKFSAKLIMTSHVIYSTQLTKRPTDAGRARPACTSPLRAPATTAARDARPPNDTTTLSYRSPDLSCAGHAGDHSNARVSPWNGLPALTGSAPRTCNSDTDSDWRSRASGRTTRAAQVSSEAARRRRNSTVATSARIVCFRPSRSRAGEIACRQCRNRCIGAR